MFVDVTGLKLSEAECMLLEQDVSKEKDTIRKLRKMEKDGTSYTENGLAPHAEAGGYRDSGINEKSATYRSAVENLENDNERAKRDRGRVLFGTVWLGGYNKASAFVERERSETVLGDMEEVFRNECDQCTQ